MLGRSDIERAYREYGHSVFRRARRITGSDQDAGEIVQEIFASLLDRPDQFSGKSSIATWLYSATTHAALNRIRNARTRTRLLEERVEPPASAIEPRIEQEVEARRILAKMPEELAQVAVHYYFDDMSHAEIASVLGCSRRHVGDLLERFHERARVEGTEGGADERGLRA